MKKDKPIKTKDHISSYREDNLVIWRGNFTRRELDEIRLANQYVNEFDHGSSGHLAMTVIAKMTALLDLAGDLAVRKSDCFEIA